MFFLAEYINMVTRAAGWRPISSSAAGHGTVPARLARADMVLSKVAALLLFYISGMPHRDAAAATANDQLMRLPAGGAVGARFFWGG